VARNAASRGADVSGSDTDRDYGGPGYGAEVSDLWHLAERADWDGARRTGSYERSTRGRSLAEEGFVHCSYPDQLAGVAERYYADAPDLVLLRIDPARIPAGVRVEGGFPHVYGPIPIAAVTAATPVARDAAGQLILPGDDTP
jgi:uncharacterized protein (DUF952 family)